MDITSARWSLAGAEAVPKLRAVVIKGDFEEYGEFHVQREHLRVHAVRYRDAPYSPHDDVLRVRRPDHPVPRQVRPRPAPQQDLNRTSTGSAEPRPLPAHTPLVAFSED